MSKKKEQEFVQVKAVGKGIDGKVAGYYNNKRILKGQVFTIKASDFTETWMTKDFKKKPRTELGANEMAKIERERQQARYEEAARQLEEENHASQPVDEATGDNEVI